MGSRRILHLGLVAFLILILVVLATVLVVRSRAFHRYLLAVIVQHAQQGIGGRVEIGDFTLHLASLRADLYRIAIHGAEPDPQKPLLWADHLAIGLRETSLERRQINLQEILVDHPVVHLTINEQGRNNLPAIPNSAPGSKPTSVFDLAIGEVVINQGEIDYNDREMPLQAALHDLHAQVSFDSSKTQYDGALSYRQGVVRFAEYNPLEHDLEARFEAAPSGLTLNSLLLTSGSSRVTAQGHLQDYSNPTVDGSYDVVLATGEFRKILRNSSLPLGVVSTRGTVHYQRQPRQPVMNSLAVEGELDSPSLAVAMPQARGAVRSLRAEYRLDHGNLDVRQMRADVLGGHMTAQFTMKNLADTPVAKIEAKVSGLDFAEATTTLTTKPPVRITGRLDATLDADWRGNMQALRAKSDLTIAASTPVAAPGAAGNDLPVNGAAHLSYDGPSGVLTLRQSSLHTPHTNVSLNGSVGKNSSLGVQAHSDDLSEIDRLLLTLRIATPSKALTPPQPPQLLGLAGSASFDGQVAGSVQNPRVTGHISGANLRYQKTTLADVKANLNFSSSSIELHQGELETSAQGRAQFDAAVGLRNWSYSPQSPIRLQLRSDQLPVADVQQLAGIEYPITGKLSVNFSAQGTQTNPTGQGTVRLVQARAWDQPIKNLSIQFQAVQDSIHSTLKVETPAGSGSVNVTFSPKDEAYDAQIDFPGIHLDRLQSVQERALPVTGVVKVSAQGRGTIRDPQLEATVEAPSLEFRQQKLDGLKVQASVAQHKATFSVDSNVVGAFVQAHGTVNLDSDYNASVNFDTHEIDLGPLLATYLSAPNLQGQTEVHGSINGPLKRLDQLEGRIEIPKLRLNYQSLQIANASPIRIGYRSRIVTLEPVELKGTGTDLRLEGTFPVGRQGDMHATANGNIDLHIIQMLNSRLGSSGQLNLNINAKGAPAHPEVQGQVCLIDAAFQAPGAPLGAEKVNGEFEVRGGRVDIKSFSAVTGGGTVTARGFASYQPAVRFDVGLSAKEVRLRYPEGVRAVLKSDLALTGTPEAATLNGQVLVDRLSFTPAFDLTNFADQFSGSSTPPTTGFMRNVKVNVSVKSTQEMSLASSQVSVQGSANLRVVGTLAEPVILGRTEISGGELFFNNLRFQIQHGTIQFANPVTTEPVLNVAVATTVQQFNITVNLLGPLDRLRTTYTSDPPLASVDIISLLFTGQTTEASAASPSTPQSVVAGQVAGQVSSRLGKLAGISSLTIDPGIGGNQSNPGASLGIQQRVTKNLFFTFTTDLTTTQGDVVQVEYQITSKYAVSAVATQNAGYSLEVKMHKKF